MLWAIIGVIFAGTIFGSLILIGTLSRIAKARRGLALDTSDNGPVAGAYERVRNAVAAGQDVDAAEIADLECDRLLPRSYPFARFLAQASVYLGLGGALVGLGSAVNRLSSTKGARTLDEVNAFVGSVTSVVANFGDAFKSALAGVIATLILSYLIALVEARRDALAAEVETIIRDRLLKKAGAERRVDPAFEQLRNAVQELSRLFQNLAPALTQSAEHIRHTAQVGAQVMDEAAGRLKTVGSEFREAQQGLRDALTEGAEKIEAAATSVAGQLSASAEEAAGAIAGGAREGGALISERLDAARLGLEQTTAATASVAVSTGQLREAAEALTAAVRDATGASVALDRIPPALEKTALAQQTLAAGIREDITDAIGPIYEQMKAQNAELASNFGGFKDTLRQHREFVIGLGETVAQMPDAIDGPRLRTAVNDALRPIEDAFGRQNASVQGILGQLDVLQAWPQGADPAIGNALSQIRERLDTVASETQRTGGDTQAQLRQMKQELDAIKGRVDQGLFGRIGRRKM